MFMAAGTRLVHKPQFGIEIDLHAPTASPVPSRLVRIRGCTSGLTVLIATVGNAKRSIVLMVVVAQDVLLELLLGLLAARFPVFVVIQQYLRPHLATRSRLPPDIPLASPFGEAPLHLQRVLLLRLLQQLLVERVPLPVPAHHAARLLEVLAVVECALPVPHALSDLRKGAGQVRGVEVVQGRLVEARCVSHDAAVGEREERGVARGVAPPARPADRAHPLPERIQHLLRQPLPAIRIACLFLCISLRDALHSHKVDDGRLAHS
mmetsp:Transcript_18729/g.48020  ORF Transcript_18729/g.48020 Transcript_18729/m.48020 type:complete len:264 (-) Transcript_18729:980-1771(-)